MPLVCVGNWRGEEHRHRPGSRQRALAMPVPGQFEITDEKSWGLAVKDGTLWGSLGVETRDSPKGFVCSSSLRGIPPFPLRYLTKKT